VLLRLASSALAGMPHALATAPGGSATAREALALCVEDGPDSAARLERGVVRAEEAIAADDRDPVAHFALFCALGRQTEAAGVRGVLRIRRVLRAIDRALELAPDWPDALAGKGSILMQLPRLLGGDATAGERLLRRAIDLDPAFAEAHFELARGLAAHDRTAAAREPARRAVELADAAGDARTARRGRALLADLGA
jgi:hypothetical protein